MNDATIILPVENTPNVLSVGNRESPEEGAFRNHIPQDEESRKTWALEGLSGLVTEISGECVTLERENESAKLRLNGEVLEEFSIWGDSPLAVIFDAIQAVLRHTGRIL
jgi:hypothetical protein